jgi:hypothetical protein
VTLYSSFQILLLCPAPKIHSRGAAQLSGWSTTRSRSYVRQVQLISLLAARSNQGAENRLTQPVLNNLITTSLHFIFLNIYFKVTPSWGKHKAGFSVLTIKLNLQVEMTNSCKRWTPYIRFSRLCNELQTTSYKLRVTSCKLRTTSYDVRDMRYELQAKKYMIYIAPTLADNRAEQHLYCSMILRCWPAPYVDRIQLNIRQILYIHWLLRLWSRCNTVL